MSKLARHVRYRTKTMIRIALAAVTVLTLSVTTAEAICVGGWGVLTPRRPSPPFCSPGDSFCSMEMERYSQEIDDYLDKLKCEHRAALEERNSKVREYNLRLRMRSR